MRVLVTGGTGFVGSHSDAVLHAAAVYNLDTRADRETRATNVPGARTVLDAAVAHVAVMAPGLGPRRYAVPGHRLDGPTLFGALRSLTGRRLPYVRVPARALLPATRLASAAQRVVPFRMPTAYEGAIDRYAQAPA